MSIIRHHNEWLSLVPNSGPFLSLPVLTQTFPQGLDAHDAEHARRLRLAFDEWDDEQVSRRPDPAIHRAWISFVLDETLGYKELLAEGQQIPQTLKSDLAEYGETLRPDWIVTDPATKKTRLLVQVYSQSQSLTKPVASSRWKTSPDTRMMQLLHDTSIRLGIVTNGFDWMLVNAPKNETTGYASWRADLWQDEPITLRAFRTILGADRLFSVPNDETLEALLDKSADDQQEVTDQLGYQVRKAVEVLIQALDKADQDHGRKLLRDLDEKVLYQAALTVMMRLVFLFCAEERELLLLGDDLYDKNYAVSTFREQLEVAKSEHTEEILGLRFDAWPRLLTTFRAVYAGVKHDRLKIPAYGGSLFDPDRFPFLEGRRAGTTWKDVEATPLPVSNRTVLHLLDALQVLQTKVGKTIEARKLSFRALDIEQIGHVYEGLLDHTAKRASEPMLGLAGTRDKEPEIALGDLEKLAAKSEKELLKFLKDETGRTESALKKALNAELDSQVENRFHTACQDFDLWERVKPFAGLVRLDTVGYPVVILPGSVFVTAGTDRRSSGTHYTPKSLTEPIVQYTLEPLVFVGPAEGLPKEQWQLRSAKELLDLRICDMACGSGAFLVQACRYMAARLLEAWNAVQQAHPGTVRITPEGQPSTGKPGEMLIPDDPDERQTYALRIVAQRCLYGVDKNPLAAEMAKLSLWLLTLAKDKPFEFLDHAIRYGDSLVGIHNLDQLRKFNLDGNGEDNRLFLQFLDEKIKAAIALRNRITLMHANTVEDVEAQDRLLREANEKIERLKCASDMLISAEFVAGSSADKRVARDHAAIKVAVHFNDSALAAFHRETQNSLGDQATFHWPLEFPEVMAERRGFDAFVGNPPFITGTSISSILSVPYRDYLKSLWPHFAGRADICIAFFLRGTSMLRKGGCTGFIGTDTVSEGDSRLSGTAFLLRNGFTIYRAVKRQQWPGEAAVKICNFHLCLGDWRGTYVLDGLNVGQIDSAFDAAEQGEEPKPLPSSQAISFTGTKVYGNGFVLSIEEGKELLHANERNRRVVKPYLVGRELNDTTCSPGRYIIDFTGMTREEAESFPEPWAVVEARVRVERQSAPEKAMREHFWQFQRPRKELYALLKERGNAWLIAATSDTVAFVAVEYSQDNPVIFSHAVNVLALDGYGQFAVVQSSVHLSWARRYGSSMKGDMRYTTTDCLENYPFPSPCRSLPRIGEQYYCLRQRLAQERGIGLTELYQLMHLESEVADDIIALRRHHSEMDRAVAAAYGWTALDLGHGFHLTKQGVRYTISEAARREILSRLLKLNHERYDEEVKQGLHEKKPKRAHRPKVKPTTAKVQPSLFDDDGTFPRPGLEDYLCGLVCDLVEADPGLSVSAYVDSLVIALGYDRHQRLLTGKDRTAFAKLCKASPLVSWSSTGRIPWAELQNLLTRRNAIKPEDETIQAGAKLREVRNSYPTAAPELVTLLRKAAAELRELQASASPENTAPKEITPELAEILQAFVNDKAQWYGVAA